MAGRITFSAMNAGRQIEVRRDAEVSDDFWRKVRAEWGQSGPRPNTSVLVSIEAFIQRQGWLPSACRQFGIDVELDDTIRELLRTGRRDRDRLREVLNTFVPGPATTFDEPPNMPRFNRQLLPFQIRDLNRLLLLEHGANFSVPGAGKTTVELALYEAEHAEGRVEQLLVVAPLSAYGAWIEDASACISPPPIVHRYAGGVVPTGIEILLVNYQRLPNSYEEIANWIHSRPTLVVLDEAHRMKRGRDGEWGTACLDISFLASRRDVLTGTPAPQHPADLVAIFNYLWPGQAQRILPAGALVAQPAAADVAAVTSAIAPLYVRTTKSELGLTPPTMKVVTVPLEGLHRQIYEGLRTRFASVLIQKDRVELGAWSDVIMYLLEAATNPALLPAGSSNEDPIEFRHPPLAIPEGSALRELIADYATYETPAKFVQIAAMVDKLRGENRKVLIWSNFVRNLETLERMLAYHQPAIVHGGIPSEVSYPNVVHSRERALERFRNEESCGVLLANPAAMGEGISLHRVCHDAIYLDRTFNAGQYLQSVDRIHRLGLDPDVETTVTFLLTEDTIDEVVASRIDKKARNLGTMLDDPGIELMSLPDEDDIGIPIDVGDDQEIEALFAHLRGQIDGG